MIVMSRKNNISYNTKMAKIPVYLNKYFQKNSFILIYPVQTGIPGDLGEEPPIKPRPKSLINLETILNKLYKSIRR
jgi:hypothetical protein